FVCFPSATENLMTTSLTGDLATLIISGEQDKALAGASMTGSFDASLLTSASQRPQSKTLTKEQLEERSALLLQQQELEREKRKSVRFPNHCKMVLFVNFNL